nr:unknown [Eimeria tenella]
MLICDDLTLSSMRTAWLKPSTEEIDAAVSAVLHDDEGQPGSYPCSVFICGLKDAKEDAGEHKLLPQVHSIVKEFLTEDEVAYHKQHVEQHHDKEHKCKPSGFPLLLKQRLHHLSARSKTDEQKRDHMHERECPDMALPCCCLYTADLEGHLRATWVSNSRFLSAGLCWVHAVDLTESDRLLLGVQLCHEVGLHALAAAISCRGALLLRSRCSLLSLWPDVKALDATIIFHTGMLWSRLLKAHERFNAGDETQRLGSWVGHPQLRASIGTGLPGELWPVVKSVFNIPRILEFYSPRNLQTPQILFNAWSMPGAFGFVPDNSWNSRELERIVKFDEEREEIFRDPVTKMGMAAPRDKRTLVQRGELVSQVNPEHGICLFTGEGKTEQYLYKDLLKSNDIWCRSGDIVERDAAGFLYLSKRVGTSFLVDGMAAPLLDLGKLLGRLPGVFGARVQGLPVFANKEREQTSHNIAQENIKTLQGGWPKTIFELLEAGEQHRRVKCLLACIHVKLGANDSTEDGELGDNRTYTCCPPSVENSLIVLGNEEEASGWKREDGNQAGSDVAMITLRAFLRRLRTSIDRGIQLSIRPNVLKLCFSICQSGDRDLTSKMCTCKPCKADNKDGGCNNGCCGDCSGNGCSRESLEGLCDLLASEDSGRKGSSCKDRGCHRCCLLFYADSNGDAFVPLTKENFKDFVRESFPVFGL